MSITSWPSHVSENNSNLTATVVKSFLAPVDIYETATQLFILVDFPGVQENDIKINIYDSLRIIAIEGVRKSPTPMLGNGMCDPAYKYHIAGSFLGTTGVTVTIPIIANLHEITSSFNNGVLQLVINRYLIEQPADR